MNIAFFCVMKNKVLQIALPLSNDNVSPVLDTAEQLLVVSVDATKVESREKISLSGFSPLKIADIIANHAEILICGALSRMMSAYLESRNVRVYPWTMGNVDRIIEMFINGDISGQEFSMPGCKRNRFGQCN
ncbi:NifB/NifX family molybdenum-iron cluster-binding protein [Candidatus Latescibacterota bacterium]